ncbi:MAG: M14 family metallopeptidase [Acidobacteriota bacterium]|nr:M14 family metallopeptidase [Acidobacteriota bacterium]
MLSLAFATWCAVAPLPPPIPWNGKSRQLIAKPDDRWVTIAEKTAFHATSTYAQTVVWLKQLAAAAPEVRLMSLGRSPEGRDIWMVIVSRDRLFTPETLQRSARPTLFVQAGIHAGEIDGKDAGLMFLRELTVTGRWKSLLDKANFLFVPIFNVDGHERTSQYGRINQRGPDVVGWRTNAQNLNLNRDYTKLDTDEMRAMIAALDRWRPDLYVDIHVTDGSDYQYDVTFGWNAGVHSPKSAQWLDGTLAPALRRALQEMGHIPGPLIPEDPVNGLTMATVPPRFSTGYGDLRHIPSMLVETHSLKPYEQRVLGTLVLLQSTLQTLGLEGVALKRAAMYDTESRPNPVPIEWRVPSASPTVEMMDYLGVESRSSPSAISGATRTEYLGRPTTRHLAVYRQNEVSLSIPRAKAYWIPAAWSSIADLLKMHGIALDRISDARDVEVDMYRLDNPKYEAEPFEGHERVVTTPRIEHRKERFPAGSYRVSTEQPLGDLVTLLLEPASSDSFLQWGFFHSIFQRTEYSEAYVTEPMAEQMLAEDPALKSDFDRRLATDEAFRASPERRLDFFYSRTPFADPRWRLYPIAREP